MSPAAQEASSTPRDRLGPGPDAELTWLLHRAAQRMHATVGAVAEESGLTLRGHIVMSALHKVSGLTQIELGQTLGMDKSTLAAEIDRLERAGYVTRLPDPRDRRARIPGLTSTGAALRARIADRAGAVEDEAVSAFSAAQVALLREMLYAIIGSAADPGSCL